MSIVELRETSMDSKISKIIKFDTSLQEESNVTVYYDVKDTPTQTDIPHSPIVMSTNGQQVTHILINQLVLLLVTTEACKDLVYAK